MAQVRILERPGQGSSQDKGILGTGVSTRDALIGAGLLAGATIATGGALPATLAAAGTAAGGAASGGGLGAMVGGLVDKPKAAAERVMQPTQIQSSGESEAISRRLQQMAANNGSTENYDKLVAAESAAAQLPESLRQEYMPALVKARMYETQKLNQYYG